MENINVTDLKFVTFLLLIVKTHNHFEEIDLNFNRIELNLAK